MTNTVIGNDDDDGEDDGWNFFSESTSKQRGLLGDSEFWIIFWANHGLLERKENLVAYKLQNLEKN